MIEFKKYFSKINNGYTFKSFKGYHKPRVEKIAEKIIKENSYSSKYLTEVSIKDKSIGFSLQVQDMFIDPFGSEVKETETKLQMLKEDLNAIMKKYLYSFNDMMDRNTDKNDIIIVSYDNKFFNYKSDFFKTIYISTRDKKVLKKLRELKFIISNDKEVKTFDLFINTWEELSFKRNIISTDFCSLNNLKIEKTNRILNKIFEDTKV